jgi:hypothetical protein
MAILQESSKYKVTTIDKLMTSKERIEAGGRSHCWLIETVFTICEQV